MASALRSGHLQRKVILIVAFDRGLRAAPNAFSRMEI